MRSPIPHNFESRDAVVREVVPAASVLQLGGQGQQHKLSEDVTWRCSRAVNLEPPTSRLLIPYCLSLVDSGAAKAIPPEAVLVVTHVARCR